jgi:hypothetical protein
MTTTFEAIRHARWLTATAQLFPGFQPVMLGKASQWRGVVGAALLGSDALILLAPRAVEGERLALADVAAANVIEDANEQYTIELQLKDAEGAPRQAILKFEDDAFFLLVFAALSNAAIECTFAFTQKRLAQLGASKDKA